MSGTHLNSWPMVGHSQNLKQVPQKYMKTFNVDDVTLPSQLMTSYTGKLKSQVNRL